ncbi:MAG TPA: hypothetical protein VI032_10645 [Burkholderiaceae bacterium]
MSEIATPDNTLAVQWVFGALVVVMYAWNRFRNPTPTRSTTTFCRYWSAAFGYVVAMLALYVLLGGGIVSFDLRALAPLIGEIPGKVASLPGPLLSALVLTSLLPHLPVLARIDESIKQWFRDVGNIPTEVRLLGTHLAAAHYQHKAHEHATPALVAAFSQYGGEAQWLAEPADSLKLRWARCVSLLAQLEQWADERGYARYMKESEADLVALRARTTGLSLTARTLTELDGHNGSESLPKLRKSVDGEVTSLWRALCCFAAGGVLNKAWSDKQRRVALARLGFSGLPQETHPLTPNDIVLVAGLVFIAMLFIPLMVRRFFDPELLQVQWRVLITVPIVYAIAIVAAIYPKSVWQQARRSASGQRPFAAYAASGVVAACAAFIVGLLFRFAFDSYGNVFQALSTPGAFAKAWSTSLERWPWLLMTLFATISIAWAADDYQPSHAEAPPWLRWAEAAALAAVFVLSEALVVELLVSNAKAAAALLAEDSERRRILLGTAAALTERLPIMLMTGGVIGACIGFLVPSLYRARAQPRPLVHPGATPQPA